MLGRRGWGLIIVVWKGVELSGERNLYEEEKVA